MKGPCVHRNHNATTADSSQHVTTAEAPHYRWPVRGIEHNNMSAASHENGARVDGCPSSPHSVTHDGGRVVDKPPEPTAVREAPATTTSTCATAMERRHSTAGHAAMLQQWPQAGGQTVGSSALGVRRCDDNTAVALQRLSLSTSSARTGSWLRPRTSRTRESG